VSNRDRLKLTRDLTTRWVTGNDNFVYSSLWDFKSYFTRHKILWHGTFPLYFPSERKVCCGFLLPLKIHCLGRVLNPQPLGPVASTPPRWHFIAKVCISCIHIQVIYSVNCTYCSGLHFVTTEAGEMRLAHILTALHSWVPNSTSSILAQNILVSTLFPTCSYLELRTQVSQPYKTNVKITFMNIPSSIAVFLKLSTIVDHFIGGQHTYGPTP
jgi:ribosomal protein S27E